MANLSIKESILELLAASGYSLNLKNDQLSSLDVHKDLKPFFDWFTLNVSKEHCISSDELAKFEELLEKDEVVYGGKLDEGLHSYNDPTQSSLIPYAESFNNTINDEVTHMKEQLHLKISLHSVLRSSISAVSDDMCNMHTDLRKAEVQHNGVLKDILIVNKEFNNKITEVKKSLEEMKENLSDLDRGREISCDEGIDTYSSDKLNCSISSISSTISTQSTYSDKGIDSKYICKIPFHEYNKQQKKFCRHLEKIEQMILAEAESIGETKIDCEVELQNIMNRLFLQKFSYITKLAELEGLKSAREKVKELSRDVQKLSWNATKSKLRREILNFDDSISDLEESFVRSADDLSDTCLKWAEFQTLKPVCDKLEDEMESKNHIITKMDKVIDVMNTKVIADQILCEMMEWEDERNEACVELYKTLKEEIQGKLNSVNKRLGFMATSIQDYNDYCALRIEERSELVEWLAAILSSDNRSVTQAVDSLTENSQKQHELLCQFANQQMQTIISVEHKMKDFYYIEVQNKGKFQERTNSELCRSIQMVLNEMYNEIMDLIIHCRSIKDDNETVEEENGVQELLKKILQSL